MPARGSAERRREQFYRQLSTACPGRMKSRIFTFVTRAGRQRACDRPLGVDVDERAGDAERGVEQQRAGNTGRRGKWSAKNGADAGTCSVARTDDAGDAAPAVSSHVRRHAGKAPGLLPRSPRSSCELARESRPAQSNSSCGSIGADAVRSSSSTRCPGHARASASRQPSPRRSARCPPRGRAMSPGATSPGIARLTGERCDRSAAKSHVRHRHPCGQLSGRLGDQARRECGQAGRDREAGVRAPRRHEGR